MSDDIETLPVVKTERLDSAEASRLKPYLSKKCKKTFFQKNKKYLFIALIFLVLSIPLLGSLIDLITKSWILTLLIKVIIFIIAAFVLLRTEE